MVFASILESLQHVPSLVFAPVALGAMFLLLEELDRV
jgi:hypothetical protein